MEGDWPVSWLKFLSLSEGMSAKAGASMMPVGWAMRATMAAIVSRGAAAVRLRQATCSMAAALKMGSTVRARVAAMPVTVSSLASFRKERGSGMPAVSRTKLWTPGTVAARKARPTATSSRPARMKKSRSPALPRRSMARPAMAAVSATAGKQSAACGEKRARTRASTVPM